MVKFNTTIKNKLGMHSRPCGQLLKLIGEYKSTVTLIGNGKEVDTKSIIKVMTMGLKQGDSIEVQVEGEDEAICAKAIEEMIEDGFGEE